MLYVCVCVCLFVWILTFLKVYLIPNSNSCETKKDQKEKEGVNAKQVLRYKQHGGEISRPFLEIMTDRQPNDKPTNGRADGLIGKFHFNKDLLDYFVLMEFFIDSIYITNVQKNNSAVSLN